jgi:hypothetical protein
MRDVSSDGTPGTADLPRDILFVDARGSRPAIPRQGTYAHEIVVLSLPADWIHGFADSWFSRQPFHIGVTPPPGGAVQEAIHAHFDRCPTLLRIGPILDLEQGPDLISSAYRLDNVFLVNPEERLRAPGKMVVAGDGGLELDYFPHSLPELGRLGFSSGREKTIARWEIPPADVEWLGPPETCTLEAGEAVLFPSNLLLSRVRGGDPSMAVIGYLRGLHPSVQVS